MRMGVRNLHIRTNAANTPISSYPLDAHTTPLNNVAGVIFHTHLTGDLLNEPDIVPVIAGVEVWDTAIGVAVLGLDDQGMKIDDVTIRRTLNQGLLLGKPAGPPPPPPTKARTPARQTTSCAVSTLPRRISAALLRRY